MKSESITSSGAPVEQIDAGLTGQFASPRIADLVQAAAIRNPDAPALVVTADRIAVSYRDLLGLVDDLAGQLTQGGLLPGDRVALRAASNTEFVVGLLAASRAGLIVVPLDPSLPIHEQCIRSQVAGVRVALVDSLDPEGVGDQREATMRCWPIAVSDGRATGAPEGSLSVHLDAAVTPNPVTSTPDGLRHDDAMIMFTGGTTGLPKMVPWTDGNIASSVRAIIAAYQLGPQDATVAVMPLYHGHGLIAALLSTLTSGGAVLLPARGRFSAHTFWDDIDAVAATWYTAVPTIHRILLELAATQSSRSKRATLRFIRSCSAPLTAETAQALREEFSVPVVCAFGMTEATHQVTTTGIELLGQGENSAATDGLVGQSTGAQIRIVGSDGQPLPPDAVGEVWLRGPTVVRGYLGDPAITAANFTRGWLRTGDLGSLSATGDLRIRGRIKELINRGGEKISPERVEGVLASHPNVLEVAVFGDPDKMYGETVAAVIVPRESIAPTPAELAVFCRDRLAAFEVPTSFQEASALPHTAKGSLDRRAVAEQFAHRG
ncbi:FadD7 family fatty acid--CoA ligase [Mycobacterium haemophilum]|uniref:Acyl-CoA synthetase n=1 Tax=Mycobacterium haemophilum TaxID=29311 RepID=A0A0I9VF87_9MYCO|nr:FadD7 family fatty acid--CoA ligase [Mycobacterium haemophilum]AKN15584.1 acyl-CoA synthetase [Mycobacterium haemophilum DSM 44634]KLO32227.1 acyl-CoA synthetase [Mycobacterium haemophilum]KLO36634.1 acyl-CoA synthetase [Mycobacterium haemophilum]KLO42562.1 acyl-CoA synthetase [Mycobacterium haemophilum]KLO55439.1 acyl-CoA synthetase [Mycobacterium haemophilum]